MRRQKCYFFIVGMFVLSLFFSLPNATEAATLDLNGSIIDMTQSNGNIVLKNGTTMVSEKFLEDTLHFRVEKNEDRFSLSNIHRDFYIDGAIGEDIISFEGKKVSLPVAVSEKEGELVLPIRPLLELFGTVDWNGEKQNITVRYDYNDQMILPEVKLVQSTVEYEIDTESGIDLCSDRRAIRTTNEGIMFEEYNENRALVAITEGDKDVIVPLHLQYAILGDSYAVEENYLYWIEYPDPVSETTGDQQWYLYLQERQEGAEPVCIDQGSFTELKTLSFGEYILQNCDFYQGNIIWLRGDGEKKELQVRLYQHETGETVILESVSLQEEPNATMEVALGGEDAIWTKSYILEDARQYGVMYRYHLDSKESDIFSVGYNLSNPIITGKYLIARLKPDGKNFIVNEVTGDYLSGVLWVYDLACDEWKFCVTTNISELEDNLVMMIPSVLDSSHIVLNFNGSFKKNKMIIVDLQNGKAHHLENAKGDMLYYDKYGWHENLVIETKALGVNGSSMMTLLKQKDSDLVGITYPVYIKW